MFTVKWIGDNDAEVIYAGREISYTPGAQNSTEKARVSFYITGQQSNVDGDSHCVIDSGRVYVMNAAGRTIADYHLSSKEFPHGISPRQAAA